MNMEIYAKNKKYILCLQNILTPSFFIFSMFWKAIFNSVKLKRGGKETYVLKEKEIRYI